MEEVKAASADLETGISAASSLHGAVVVGAGWAPWWGGGSFCGLARIRNKTVNEQFQLVTGVASLCGWP